MAPHRAQLSITDAFIRLAEVLPSYEHRPQQFDLASAIARSFDQQTTGIFEAGTGTGKTLAALIPAALSGKRVVVSTNTISLQEQYINKDIPTLKSILPFNIEAVLLKGRGNYVGLRRWEEHLLQQEVADDLVDWVQNSTTGDVSELDFMPNYETWFEINSNSDDCLRNKCPKYNSCFYFNAKKQAEEADILVVNHALLLADASSHGNILPKYDLLIVDEAHHLPDVATNAFSVSLNNRGLRAVASKAVKKVGVPSGLVNDIEYEAFEFFNFLLQRCHGMRTRLREGVPQAQQLAATIEILKAWLDEQTFDFLLDVEMARERAKLKAKAIISTLNGYLACLSLVAFPDPSWVVWVERDLQGTRVEIVAAPLDVSPFIREHLIERNGLEASVWMSATLATGGDDPFGFFKSSIGTDRHVIQQVVQSPFDFKRQSFLYLPKNLPEPNNHAFIPRAAEEIDRILSISDGRAFVLFTSKAAMNGAYDLIGEHLAFPCKKQGDMPRKRLIEWFLDTPNAVLFGTSSFWEGVSIDGDKLSCVIIDRIPFQGPDDPVHEARCDVLKSDPERSWFTDLSLPHATMRLKQGLGRLIRTHKDRGMAAILDSRLTTKSYGKRILACLPPMPVVRSLDHIVSLEDHLEQQERTLPPRLNNGVVEGIAGFVPHQIQ
ncbi:MAG TPA: helicase C-terminal domain-containing protein [Trichormus sp.]